VKRALVAAAVFVSSGCARNAFLELTIELPKDADGRFAVTQVMAGAPDFTIAWGTDDPIAPIKLDPNSPQSQRLSIEGDTDNESTPISVKVAFCKQADCLAPTDSSAPFAGLKIERAFYIGKRTSFAWKLDCIPGSTGCTAQPTTDVPKCGVAGCRAGVTSSYCAGGKHYCEED